MNDILEKIIRKKDDNITLLEATVAVAQEDNLDITELAEIIKKNKTFLSIIQNECQQRGLLKNKTKNNDINDII